MTTAKTHNGKPTAHAPVPTPPSAPLPPPPATNGLGKKKKKKKGKGGNGDDEYVTIPVFQDDYEDEEDVSSLEPADGSPRTGPHARMEAEIESVHFHAAPNGNLSPSAAAAARLNATAAAQAELLATANDLYRRMDADPQGGIADDDEYWASLPAHIRNFVRLSVVFTVFRP
jgi:hypothetical protein